MWLFNPGPQPNGIDLVEVHGVGECLICHWRSETTEHFHIHVGDIESWNWGEPVFA